MTDTLTTTSRKTMNVSFALPDAATAADSALAEALASCARKMHLADAGAVLTHLQRGDRTARAYFEYDLAQRVAEHLGALDEEVRAVYLYDAEATPEDSVFGEVAPSLIHLIVWAQRETKALNSLIVALERALVQRYAERIGAPGLMCLLDTQIVDDAQVNARTGYGALLASLHHRPVQVWKR
ncbi:MAG: hypothetical protein CVU38_20560 [Chloroflexi bacterium HGW-Chloroflexi-1]|nr:MAG: hypothetical protein CVU38_20560 [Chloroflexi bacterium HGW-Chloroflexi-1]